MDPSQITGDSMVCSTAYKENTKAPHCWSFCEGKPPIPGDFPHKGPVKRNAFPWHDVTMITVIRINETARV